MTKPDPRAAARCPACDGDMAGPAFAAALPGFSVLACPACGLGRTWPPVPAGKIGAYYPQQYYGSENVRFNPLFEAMTRLFQRRRARLLSRLAAPGAVLDVGCGRGFLLAYLRLMGYEPRGLELSEHAAWHARHRLGLEVASADFLSFSARPESFDMIVFWHTLEHFPEPEKCLSRAAELLKPAGLLAVAVPNFASLQARLFGRHWFHLDIPRHYTHFSERSLRALLERRRLGIARIDHFCFEQNPFGWLQSFYNALGFERDFLYSMLKARSARALRIRRHPIQALLTLALLPLLLPLSLALTLLEAALRRGGTIEVYAIKR
ncbi:MAG: class I SAM-dependent methyltransferase [Elusimicrobia bacterium]|nr:class I SAM-dependent methyltransferase [Elusimicrobiota bacterium]MDE2237052.1 class I SAM-dependent methyltransferase [Elusimicrobiota bacterium]MDE2427025.1 class I SAM-dependent methyltransferase [Elusimicrobiota bacterium]